MVKEKAVFNVDTGRIETMRFLCLNKLIRTIMRWETLILLINCALIIGWISGCAIENEVGLFYSGGLASFLLTLIFCTPKFVRKKK